LIGCLDEPLDSQPDLSTTEAALTDSGILPDVPGMPVPAGYGNYCSVTDPSNGGWALRTLTSGDSCASLSRIVGSKAIVQRAGLWAIRGNNNVMVRCDGGILYYGRDTGSAAIDWIFNQVSAANKNCVFTIAPTQLFAFGMPFQASAKITGTSVFGYHLPQLGFAAPWNVADFGFVGADACEVDRTGAMTANCTAPIVKLNNPYAVPEAAYDWSMLQDTPVLAVADGIIRASYGRSVAAFGCPQTEPGSDQQELFLETQVGSGQYAEHFVVAYHHMNSKPNLANPVIALNVASWGNMPMAPAGTVVKKGDVIAYVGSTGCSTQPHLDLMAFRLTNLTGARSYTFAAVPTGATGVNGWQGVFDPFGWAAPKGVDPLAYKFIGLGNPANAPASITDLGTFSINVWDPVPFINLPHNGGLSH
jgi:hypothetical protein